MFAGLRMSFYAVARGKQTGIFRTWAECENQVKGFSGAVFKKFKTQQEAHSFIDGQPAAKRQKIQFNQKANFSKAFEKANTKATSKVTQTEAASDSDDEIFKNLDEYPDEPVKLSKNKRSASTSVPSKPSKHDDPLAIKFVPPLPTTTKVYKGIEFNEDAHGLVHVYTDGSCENNGKFGAAAGLGVYFGSNHPLNASEPVTGKPTNNAGEIQAAIRAIRDAQRHEVKRLNIFTDSQFVMNSVCKWMPNWKKKEWKLSTGKKVVNFKNFQELDALIENGNMLIKWSYIPAHKGYDGNEEADKLAKIGAVKYRTNKQRTRDGSDSDDLNFLS